MSDQAQRPTRPDDPAPQAPAESGVAAGTPETPDPAAEKSLDQLLLEAQARIEEQREAVLRALADAENARKRAQVEVSNAHKFGVEKFAETLLPAVFSEHRITTGIDKRARTDL